MMIETGGTQVRTEWGARKQSVAADEKSAATGFSFCTPIRPGAARGGEAIPISVIAKF